MKLRLALLTALCASFAMTVGGIAALASNGSATPFKAAYGSTSCSGSHVVNKQGTKDSETCLATGVDASWPVGTFTSSPCPPDLANPVPPGTGCILINGVPSFWISDYAYFVSPGGGAFVYATSWSFTAKTNPDGSQTVDLVANF